MVYRRVLLHTTFCSSRHLTRYVRLNNIRGLAMRACVVATVPHVHMRRGRFTSFARINGVISSYTGAFSVLMSMASTMTMSGGPARATTSFKVACTSSVSISYSAR